MAYRMAYIISNDGENDFTEDTGTRIFMRNSGDGVIWGEPYLAISELPTYVVKGPRLTKMSGGDLWCVYNRISSPATVEGTYYRISEDDGATWGSANQVTGAHAQGAPIIEVTNGDLICPHWIADGGAIDSRLLRSSDSGDNWGSEVLIADGSVDSKNYSEPNILEISENNLLCTIRETDLENIYTSTSADNGATWSAPAEAFAGNGAPMMSLLSSGDVICCTRQAAGNIPVYFVSEDNGATWGAEQVLMDAGRQTYGNAVELSGERVGFAYGAYWTVTTDGALYYTVKDFVDV